MAIIPHNDMKERNFLLLSVSDMHSAENFFIVTPQTDAFKYFILNRNRHFSQQTAGEGKFIRYNSASTFRMVNF